MGAPVHRLEGPITARMVGPAEQCGARPQPGDLPRGPMRSTNRPVCSLTSRTTASVRSSPRFDNTSRRSPYLDLCAGFTYEEHPIGSAQDRRHGHDTLTPRHLGTVDQPHEAAGINRRCRSISAANPGARNRRSGPGNTAKISVAEMFTGILDPEAPISPAVGCYTLVVARVESGLGSTATLGRATRVRCGYHRRRRAANNGNRRRSARPQAAPRGPPGPNQRFGVGRQPA